MLKRRVFLSALFVTSLGAISACSGGGSGETIRVGAKDFTEQYILGNMYQMVLEDAGFDATYTSIGGSSENHQALLSGEIDVYPEYVGTALLTHLGGTFDSSMTAESVYDTVKEQYAEEFNLAILEPTSFSNSYVFAMTQDEASSTGISTISELSQQAGDLTLGTTQEFTQRDDGIPGLKEAYGGFNFEDVKALDPGLLYSGIEDGSIDVTTGFGTDGQIAAYDLVVLEDDKNFFPPYPAVPVVRQEVLDANPDIAEPLNRVSAALDSETMSALNWEVAGNGREADEVAREFLEAQGLIGN
ncbi:glycine/betaine ABC transporter [Romeria aff. gracilis LEGE 07310]|uniref:Glycine/betaine ABC transporter n=2 Tax=Vasconcelosia TaxID=3366328 RepID=A0A8J7AJ54_9CYAN|nr:glycine/betaine ABC transporter [Romeria aff. gracilis LEGE 07310]